MKTKLLYLAACIVILATISLTSCGIPFTLTHNADGSTTVTPPPQIIIPARSAK